jgi:hypothetical protein
MLTIPVIIFASCAVLFFIMSLFTNGKIRLVFLNVIFLVLVYVSVANILGEPKPVTNIPLYSHAKWDDAGVVVVGGYWNNDYIYLLLQEDRIRLYAWPQNPEFLDEIKKAQEGRQAEVGDRWGFKLKASSVAQEDSKGGDPAVEMADPQAKVVIPKNSTSGSDLYKDYTNDK